MSDWIRWCKCGRRILTTKQMNENKPCEICQKEQGENIEVITREEFNG